MKGAKLILGITLSLGTLGAAVGGAVLTSHLKEKSEIVQAATATTVYYAVPSATVGSYTVKCNINRQGDADNWQSYVMTKETGKTYNGKDIYKAQFTDLYDGVGAMQFQLYDGDTWKSQQQPISSWTLASAYNGKLYEHDVAGWKDYGYDVTKTVFLDVYDWATLKVHYWNTGRSGSTWPGDDVSFTDSNLRFNGENSKLQAFTFNVISSASGKFLYQSAADTNKSDDFDITDGAYYWHNGTAWVQETGDLAAAANYVWAFNTARLAVPASSKVKAYSICGLDLDYWYGQYNSLSSGAKAKVKEASIFTYKDAGSSDADTRVSFEEIVDYMAEEVGAGSRYAISIVNENTVVVASVVGVICIVMGATVGFYFLRKRKQSVK